MHLQKTAQQVVHSQCRCQPVPCCSTSRLSLARQPALVSQDFVCSSHMPESIVSSNAYCTNSQSSRSRQLQPPSTQHRRRCSVVTAAAAAADGFADNSHSHGNIWSHSPALLKQVQDFVSAQYLPIALVCALTLGAVNPSLGLAASKMHIPALATFGIFTVQVNADTSEDSDVYLASLVGHYSLATDTLHCKSAGEQHHALTLCNAQHLTMPVRQSNVV